MQEEFLLYFRDYFYFIFLNYIGTEYTDTHIEMNYYLEKTVFEMLELSHQSKTNQSVMS